MHYRNGRPAQNGDLIVQLSGFPDGRGGKVSTVGVLFDARPGIDYCNGSIAPIGGGYVQSACLCDCLHADDLAAILAEKGLDKRPVGK